ncbi:MAG: GTPase Era [Deltaproteobacteria bacterium]|nr:GTPase Era [Deltaproteobacteria bacterium]
MTFKCGHVALVGQPNAGKSTLLNALIGEQLAIVTPKPQTTRHRIVGILNREDSQIAFVDTPGFHKPFKPLNSAMVEVVDRTIDDVDIVCLLIAPKLPLTTIDRQLFERIGADRCIVVVNKGDTVDARASDDVARKTHDEWGAKETIVVSALHGLNVPFLVRSLVEHLPEGQALHSTEGYTEHPVRFLVSEIVREQVFLQMGDEIPYNATVEIESFKDATDDDPIARIEAAIIVERENQKAMVIGKAGKRIKEIGTRARVKIEDLIGEKVFLKLVVRVDEEWSSTPQKLRDYGYVL